MALNNAGKTLCSYRGVSRGTSNAYSFMTTAQWDALGAKEHDDFTDLEMNYLGLGIEVPSSVDFTTNTSPTLLAFVESLFSKIQSAKLKIYNSATNLIYNSIDINLTKENITSMAETYYIEVLSDGSVRIDSGKITIGGVDYVIGLFIQTLTVNGVTKSFVKVSIIGHISIPVENIRVNEICLDLSGLNPYVINWKNETIFSPLSSTIFTQTPKVIEKQGSFVTSRLALYIIPIQT